jgi:hypothetical protein
LVAREVLAQCARSNEGIADPLDVRGDLRQLDVENIRKNENDNRLKVLAATPADAL